MAPGTPGKPEGWVLQMVVVMVVQTVAWLLEEAGTDDTTGTVAMELGEEELPPMPGDQPLGEEAGELLGEEVEPPMPGAHPLGEEAGDEGATGMELLGLGEGDEETAADELGLEPEAPAPEPEQESADSLTSLQPVTALLSSV